MVMFRKIPLFPELISMGNNVRVASHVTFITHDVIHSMLNEISDVKYSEHIGCIFVGDNVFIGTNTTILPNVIIDSNTIIAAGSVVTKDLIGGGVYGGIPARRIDSLENFMCKRKAEQFAVKRRKSGRLTDPTLEFAWDKINMRLSAFSKGINNDI